MLPVASSSRVAVKDFVRSLGFEPDDVRSVEITSEAITVTTYRRDEGGRHFAAGGRPAMVTTEIRIEP